MANYNKVILLGNLTRDPQLSYLPSQTAVVDFGLAINRTWKGQDGSQKKETCFVDCQMFGRRAEVINKYLHKGDQLFVEGRLKFDSWEAKDGSKRSKLRVTVENFEFVGSGQRANAEPDSVSQEPPPAMGMTQDNGTAADDIPF